MGTAIKAFNLTKRYDSIEALKNINVEIYENEVAVLLGPNGSGKSTFIKISAGVLFPTSGKIEVFGREPYRDIEVKGSFSYMPQDQGLYNTLTGYENYIFYCGIQGVEKSKALSLLEDIKDFLDLGDWFYKRKVNTYSGGMKRKTSLLVALSTDPKLLIIDEPTTGLDPSARREFWRLLQDLKRRGKTVLMATHLFEDAEAVADKIIIMYRGEIIASSSPDMLKRRIGYKYAIDVEFSDVPDKKIFDSIIEEDINVIFDGGYTATLLCNDPSVIDNFEKKLRSSHYVSINLRRVSLSDVYFVLTGVRLK